jgi:VIT1/CCC1 family predicted Fe2+/Mn2+ transporter
MAKVPFPPAKYGLWLAIVIIGAVLLLMVTGVIAAQVD